MEWNFLFRIDHLKETGEERNLKGLIFTEGSDPPTPQQILHFLKQCGYRVQVEDAEKLIFADHHPEDPVKISIVKLGNEEDVEHDPILKSLAEQFRKSY